MIEGNTRVLLDCLSMSWAAVCAQSVEAFNLSPAERKTAYSGPEVKWSAAGLDCVHGHGLWWRWRVFVCLHRVWCPAFHLPPSQQPSHSTVDSSLVSLCSRATSQLTSPPTKQTTQKNRESSSRLSHSIFWSWEENVLCSLAKGNRKLWCYLFLMNTIKYIIYVFQIMINA